MKTNAFPFISYMIFFLDAYHFKHIDHVHSFLTFLAGFSSPSIHYRPSTTFISECPSEFYLSSSKPLNQLCLEERLIFIIAPVIFMINYLCVHKVRGRHAYYDSQDQRTTLWCLFSLHLCIHLGVETQFTRLLCQVFYCVEPSC